MQHINYLEVNIAENIIQNQQKTKPLNNLEIIFILFLAWV